MSEQKFTGDFLKIDDSFDPMGLDITYIQETVDQIPKDGLIDINDAERLATLFLRCADYCGDLVAKAISYMGQQATLQKAAKSTAIYNKIKEKVTPTVAKEAYADDNAFIDASNKATTAEALLKFLEIKLDNLTKAHILCKNILARHMPNERANSWQGSETEEDYTSPAPSSPSPTRRKITSNAVTGPMKPGFVDLD